MPSGFEQLSVLIVDDNAHMRALLRALLEAIGISTLAEARDGETAFAHLLEQETDLVLADMTMAPMDGIAFTRKVRTHTDSPNPFLPIIMITGHTGRHRVIEARDAGVNAFLAKPVSTGDIASHITAIITRPRPFVRCRGYFGPDRRRHGTDNHAGPWRRHDDFAVLEAAGEAPS